MFVIATSLIMLYMYSFVLHRSYLLFFFAGLKAHANGRNKSQHRCVLTLLGVFGEQCCVRLYGPKSLTDFKLYATSVNKCQHCCGSMQTDATCWAQQCCVLLVNNVASICIGLNFLVGHGGGKLVQRIYA